MIYGDWIDSSQVFNCATVLMLQVSRRMMQEICLFSKIDLIWR